ncbi:MAG: nitronate monooxygenase [Halieaceae bacterium]|jgi:nitronate monooxygenase|nr:nitronate monooxygenase [Halieaceae bacterium]
MATPSSSNPPFPAELPIVQAPMAGVQDSALTLAVSEAGALGSLACAMLSSDALQSELDAIQSAGCRNYNLNFFCHSAADADAQREARWRQALDPYYREYGIAPDVVAGGAGRAPFCAATLDLIQPYRPPVVSFHFGLPRHEWIDAIKAWGGSVWSTATTVEEARWLESHGADAVIAQGVEAGGHRGMFLTRDLSSQTGTVELLASILEAVSIPVIAAGAIASPDAVRDAIDSGAWAVQAGTAYLCCSEAKTTPLHRQLLEGEGQPPTELTNVFSGRAARGIVNRLISELGPISDLTPEFPGAATALAPLRSAAEALGHTDFSPLWCGTDASACRRVDAGEQTGWLASKLPRRATLR